VGTDKSMIFKEYVKVAKKIRPFLFNSEDFFVQETSTPNTIDEGNTMKKIRSK
jgi:hypothetical protein